MNERWKSAHWTRQALRCRGLDDTGGEESVCEEGARGRE